jgi:hypothetical protein
MAPTIPFDALARRTVVRLAMLGAPLLAVLGACAMTPLPVAAQPTPPIHGVVEGYVARSQLHPTVAGPQARLEAVGARLLLPVEQFAADAPRWLAERVAVGGFLSSAATEDRNVAARHYGAQADLRLTRRPVAGRLEPLASLGIGAFRARREAPSPQPLNAVCLTAPADATVKGVRCLSLRRPDGSVPGESFALSPALGARLALVPGLALRLDARDLIVYQDGPRHNRELVLGLSFSR